MPFIMMMNDSEKNGISRALNQYVSCSQHFIIGHLSCSSYVNVVSVYVLLCYVLAAKLAE